MGSLEITLSSLNKLSIIWFMLRGITLWSIWVERNDLTFTIISGTSCKFNKPYGKVFFSMLHMHGMQLIKERPRTLLTRIHLGTMIKCGEGTNFLTTDVTLKLCIGMSKHLILSSSTILRLYMDKCVSRFHRVHPREFYHALFFKSMMSLLWFGHWNKYIQLSNFLILKARQYGMH